jgi:hypothetical protein
MLGKQTEIDSQMDELQNSVSGLFDCPELQKLEVRRQLSPIFATSLMVFKYELRAVLMYTGLPGRKNMYSYVQDPNGTWWKTLDSTITEVWSLNWPISWQIFTDPTFTRFPKTLS